MTGRIELDTRRGWESGEHVVGVKCPKCKRKSILYNGNYFCGGCSWAMSERRSRSNDRIIVAYLRQCRGRATTIEEIRRMDFHLDVILDRRLA